MTGVRRELNCAMARELMNSNESRRKQLELIEYITYFETAKQYYLMMVESLIYVHTISLTITK